ncbi:AAA family ATPase [Succinivibrio sp.]|uniref:AAA family ATPase n=1 Tax=Succinivibrio sp. TaxID=2053619 RepID=UPI0038637906
MKTISNSWSFSDFLDDNYIYIDKTETIYNLLKNEKKVFISRPRRFGKSLTLDTIGTLYEYGVNPYFKNTWIFDKWTEPTYPVLRIDFLKCSVTDIDDFKKQFVLILNRFASKHKLSEYEQNSDPATALDNLLEGLKAEDKKVVILIDEYDRQLTANITNSELYDKFREIQRNLYAIMKSNTSIKFLAVTGVTRLKDTAIFSAGSDIKDISNYSEYSQLIGFTREEIKHFYIEYIKLTAAYENSISTEKVNDLMIEALLDKLAYYYDGYCFDKKYQKKVFSTWSVNNFFQEVKSSGEVFFGDYWFENGGIPSILANYLKDHELKAFDYLDENSTVTVSTNSFLNPTSLLNIDQNVLMCQTGYLTLRSSLSSGESKIDLGIPNREIYKALLQLISLNFFCDNVSIRNDKRENILDCGNARDIIELFNKAINTIAYDKFPIKSEHALESLIMLYLLGAGVDVCSESHSSKGRSDLKIERENRRIVIEFKFAKNEKEAKNKLKEAVEQIRNRDYGNTLPLKSDLLRIAAVYNSDPTVRKISDFELV